MRPEKLQHEGESKNRERESPVAGRRSVAESAAISLTDNPYETAQELAERLKIPFMTYEQAKQQGLIIKNARGNWEPAPGYRFVDDPARRERRLRNWAVKKLEVDPREVARLKGLPFMSHKEAVRKNLVVRNTKGNWEPTEGYKWVDDPNKSGNWAVKMKLPAPAPKPTPKPGLKPALPAPSKPAPLSRFGDKIVKAKKNRPQTPKPLPPPAMEPDLARQAFLENRLDSLEAALEDLHGDLEELDDLQGFIYTSIDSGGNYKIIFVDDDYVKIEVENPIYPDVWMPAPGTGLIKISDANKIVDTLVMLDTTLYQTPDSMVDPAKKSISELPEWLAKAEIEKGLRKITSFYGHSNAFGMREWINKHKIPLGSPEIRTELNDRVKTFTSALYEGMKFAGIPVTKEIIAILCSHLLMESGGNVVGIIDGKRLFADLKNKYKKYYTALGILRRLDDDLDTRANIVEAELRAARTEQDLYIWAQKMLSGLNEARAYLDEYSYVPGTGSLEDGLKNAKLKLTTKPSTLGPFQVNIDNLRFAIQQDIAAVRSDPRLRVLLTPDGGSISRDKIARSLMNRNSTPQTSGDVLPLPLAIGITLKYYIRPIYESNSDGLQITRDDIPYIFADYHNGLGSSRNAAIQKALNTCLKNMEGFVALVADGDIVNYSFLNSGDSEELSNSENAIILFIRNYLPQWSSSAKSKARAIVISLSNRNSTGTLSPSCRIFLSKLSEQYHVITRGKMPTRAVANSKVNAEEAALRHFRISSVLDYAERGIRNWTTFYNI